MDSENNGKPYEQMDDLGVFPYFWKHPHILQQLFHVNVNIFPQGQRANSSSEPAVSTVQGPNETLETPNRQGSSGINVQKRTREISVVSSNAGTHVGLQLRFKQLLAGENIQTRHWPKMLKHESLRFLKHSAHTKFMN